MYYIAKQNDLIVGFGKNLETLKSTLTLKSNITIEKTDTKYVDYEGVWLTEDEVKEKERKYLDNLHIRRGDMFEALILAKGITETKIQEMIEAEELDEITKALYLNRLKNAVDFYRGYPVMDLLCAKLKIKSEALDNFFVKASRGNQEAYKFLIGAEND